MNHQMMLTKAELRGVLHTRLEQTMLALNQALQGLTAPRSKERGFF